MMLVLSKDSPLHNIQNPQTRICSFIAFIVGFFLGYVSFVIGSILAVEGIRALIRVLWYRSSWIEFLRSDVPKLFRKTSTGKIRNWSIEKHPLTKEIHRYQIWYEYDIILPKSTVAVAVANHNRNEVEQRTIQRHIDSHDGRYSQDVVRRLLQQMLKNQQNNDDNNNGNNNCNLKCLYLIQYPKHGLPLQLVDNKIQDMIYWSQYMDIGIAFFGLQTYLGGAFIYGCLSMTNNYDLYFVLLQAILALILMFPYLLIETKIQHQRRIRQWKEDPLLVFSEIETIQQYWYHWFGPTYKDNLSTICFFVAVSILFLSCGLITLVMAILAVYCIVQWINASSPIQRETMETFERNATMIQGVIIQHWRIPPKSCQIGATKYYVKIQYRIPSSGELVIKDIQSEVLYYRHRQQLKQNNRMEDASEGTSIDIMIDSTCPLSGYPRLQFTWDYNQSWNLCMWHITCFVTLWLYLMVACWVLDVDLDYPPEEVIVSISIIVLGPILLFPYAVRIRKKQYDQYILRLYETGKIVAEKRSHHAGCEGRMDSEDDDWSDYFNQDSSSGSACSDDSEET